MSERLRGSEPLQEMILCREHMSLLGQTGDGRLLCVTGGEEIVTEDQIVQTVGRFIPFEYPETGEDILDRLYGGGTEKDNTWIHIGDS